MLTGHKRLFSIPFRTMSLHTKKLVSKGLGVFGALGDTTLQDRDSFTDVDIYSLKPAKIACGWGHSAVVCSEGRLVVFGRPFDFSTVMRINGINETFGGTAARLMNKLTLKIDKDAESGLYLDPRVIDSIEGCVDVRASAGLTVVLTKKGEVYTFGLNRWGQCGTGSMSNHIFEPFKLQGLVGVVAIDAGLQHCVCVNSAGRVYAWGKGNRGQLGDGLKDSCSSPVVVPVPGHVIGVSAGFAHSAALTTDGAVWVWGKGMSKDAKEVGARSIMPDTAVIDQFEDQILPRKVTLPGERKAVEICSSSFTLAIRADDGSLWLLGMGEYDRNRVSVPLQVHDEYTQEEISGEEEPRQACIPADTLIRKGHNRITLIDADGSKLVEAVLHDKTAFLQTLPWGSGDATTSLASGSTNKSRKVKDIAVGWKHSLAITE